jgi:hypothetical protein
MTMPRHSLVAAAAAVAVLALAACSVAIAAPPAGFSPPQTIGSGVQVSGAIVAADAAGGQPAAVAFTDRSGHVWAGRVRADGSVGSPLPAAAGQIGVRDLQVAVTDRGELVVVWAALVNRNNGGSAVRYAVAPPGRSFSGTRTLAAVGSNTSATPRIAALRGETLAVIFRDTPPLRTSGVLRYARRAPHGSFGPARSLGRDGVSPEIQASPGGGALLAWEQGPLTRRALVVASARRGASLPGPATSVAGSVRSITLAASADGTAWVTWTRRDSRVTTGFARRTRSSNRSAVGPVQSLGTVAYGVPHVALGASGSVLAAWNARGPGAIANVGLASAEGLGAVLGAPSIFDAGGFSSNSPSPALRGSTPLVLFTRQIGSTSGEQAQAVAADPATGDATLLADAGASGTPAVAHSGPALLVAWPAQAGGVAVSVDR